MKKGTRQGSREQLSELLGGDPELLERGLEMVEKEVEVGQVLVDLLCVDAAGRPVLVYLARNWTEEQEVPLRVMDGDFQFRRYRPVLRKIIPGGNINWDLAPRSLVAARDFSRQTMERFISLSGIETDLVEMRAIKVRGEERWAGIPVAGEAAQEALLPPEMVPESLEDTCSRDLWHSVYDRILKLDANLDVLSEKYFREVSCRGDVLAVMKARGGSFTVAIPDDSDSPRLVDVKSEEDADQSVDLVIQRYLALHVGDLDNDPLQPEEVVDEGGWEDDSRKTASSSIRSTVEATSLSDEEISAFLEFQDGTEE